MTRNPKAKQMSKAAANRIKKDNDQANKNHVELEERQNIYAPSKAEVDAAVLEPRYRFEERVGMLMKKGNTRAQAEKNIRTVIAEKELPGDRPHIHITASGDGYFVCGDIGFQIDTKDIDKALGTQGESNPLHRLMDSQVIALAHSAGLQTEPFVSELVIPVLRGLVQIVWYRDLPQDFPVNMDNLNNNQVSRIDKYHKLLREWKAPTEEAPTSRKSRASGTGTGSAKILIPAEQHKKLLELHKKGESTGAIAVALGLERSKSSRAAIRSTLRGLEAQK